MKKIILIIIFILFFIYMYYDFIIFDFLNVLQIDNGDDFDDYDFNFRNKIKSILFAQPDPQILVPGPGAGVGAAQGAWVPLGPLVLPQNPAGGPNDLVVVAVCICVITVGAVVVCCSIQCIRTLLK